jgi:hypothetical protein
MFFPMEFFDKTLHEDEIIVYASLFHESALA